MIGKPAATGWLSSAPAVLALFWGTLSACTEFAPSNDILVESAPASPAATASADWSCLTTEQEQLPFEVDESERIQFTLPLVNLLGGAVTGAVARACRTADPTCENPFAAGTRPNAEGALELDLYRGFDGYIEITADDRLPVLWYLEEPLEVASRATFGTVLFPLSAVGALAAANGGAVRSDLGIFQLGVFDCSGNPVPSSTFGNEVGGLGFYFSQGVPRLGVSETDASGFGGFVNVPTGVVQVWVDSPGRGRWGSRTVFVRSGWTTGVAFRPPR